MSNSHSEQLYALTQRKFHNSKYLNTYTIPEIFKIQRYFLKRQSTQNIGKTKK